MRKLAQELGVEAMSLYHYVSDKDDILDGIVEVVIGEIEVPAGADWKAAPGGKLVSAARFSRATPGGADLVALLPRAAH